MPSGLDVHSLLRPNQQSSIEASDISDTAAAIDALQTHAMEESGQAQFAKGYSIEISVTGPNMPNTTLVDLPGFTSSSDEDTELVLDIVTPYLEMDNTTVLHVCKGDMDYGSLLGNDVIRKYYDKVIHVFTHLDRLDESQQRSVMNSIMSGSGEPRFGILGKYSGDPRFEKAETMKLSAFRGFQDKFQYGREALIEHMESFQAQRLVERLPQTAESLNSMRTQF